MINIPIESSVYKNSTIHSAMSYWPTKKCLLHKPQQICSSSFLFTITHDQFRRKVLANAKSCVYTPQHTFSSKSLPSHPKPTYSNQPIFILMFDPLLVKTSTILLTYPQTLKTHSHSLSYIHSEKIYRR